MLADLVGRGWVLRPGDHYLPGPALLRLSGTAAATPSLRCAGRSWRPRRRDGPDGQPPGARGRRVPRRGRRPARPAGHDQRTCATSSSHDRFAGPLALVAALDAGGPRPLPAPPKTTSSPCSTRSTDRRATASRSSAAAPAAGRLAEPRRHHAAGAPVCALTLVGPDPELDDARLPALRVALARATDALAESSTTLVADPMTTDSPVLILDAADTDAALDPTRGARRRRHALIAISRGTVSAPPRIAARSHTACSAACRPMSPASAWPPN